MTRHLNTIAIILPLFLLATNLTEISYAFVSRGPSRCRTRPFFSTPTVYSARSSGRKASEPSNTPKGDKFRRQRILSPPRSSMSKRGDGNHFQLERFRGNISFGYTTDLITTLPVSDSPSPQSSVTRWLSDAERVAFAIWDENLMKDLGNQMYRLQLITLQFVTIKLNPEVDVLMWTEKENEEDLVFLIESEDFNPNVQLLPGVKFSAESLGIQIDVAGELRVSKDGRGLTGKIGFITSGVLPPPLRILPERALSSAAGIINRQIADFAVKSFQKGAVKEYSKFKNLVDSK